MRQLVIADDSVNSSFVSNQFKIIEQHICHCIFWRSFPYWLVHATPASGTSFWWIWWLLYTFHFLPALGKKAHTMRFSMVIFFLYVITHSLSPQASYKNVLDLLRADLQLDKIRWFIFRFIYYLLAVSASQQNLVGLGMQHIPEMNLNSFVQLSLISCLY